jgi:O-antigen/teichoic acid export membrane protein
MIIITREMAKRPEWASHYLTAAGLLTLGLLPLAALFLMLLAHLPGYTPATRTAMYLACIALVPGAMSQVVSATFVAFEKAQYLTYGTVLENVLRNGLSILALALGYGVLELVGILIVTRVCMLVYYLAVLKRHWPTLHWAYEGAFFTRLFRDWRVFAYENWLSNLFGHLDLIVLSFFHGERAVGFYAAASRLLNLGVVVAESYTTAIFPYLSRLFEESKEQFQRLLEGSIKYMVVLVLPTVAAIAILADPIIIWLYQEAYIASVPILRVLIWVLVLRFVNPFLSHILFAQGKQHKSLHVAAISLACHGVLAFWLIPHGEGVGAAWAMLLSVSVRFGLYFGFVLQGQAARRMLFILGRILLAAGGASLLLFGFRQLHLVLLLGAASLAYVFLLALFGVLPRRDFRLFRAIS